MTTDISARAIIKILLIILGVFFIFILRDVIFILLFSVFLASAINPAVTWLKNKRIPRLASVLAIYTIFFALLSLFLTFVAPILATELNQLTQALPKFFESSIDVTSTSAKYLDFVGELQVLFQKSYEYLLVSSGSISAFLLDVFGGVISFISIVVISFYFSVMEQGVTSFFKSVVPKIHEDYALQLWHRIEAKVGRWFQGQLFLAVVVGLIVYGGLTLLGVKYALLLGILAMALELIPFVGPVMSAIPAIALAFLQAPLLGLWVFLLYIGVQQLENQFLAPVILGKTTGMHPVTVIISLLIGAKLAGILGMMLAVPVAVVLIEIFEELAQQRRTATPM